MHLFKTMFEDPFLFHALGTHWRLSKFCVACGGALMLVGVLFALVLAVHTKTHWRKLNATEAARVAFHAARAPGEVLPAGNVASVGARGAEIQMSIDIDGFRRAARRGDWLTFFLWPISLSCWIIGMWMVFTAFMLYMPPAAWVILSIFVLVMEGICLFMPFAALFTNIDAPVDTPAVQPQQRK
jgi:hypothetical protein